MPANKEERKNMPKRKIIKIAISLENAQIIHRDQAAAKRVGNRYYIPRLPDRLTKRIVVSVLAAFPGLVESETSRDKANIIIDAAIGNPGKNEPCSEMKAIHEDFRNKFGKIDDQHNILRDQEQIVWREKRDKERDLVNAKLAEAGLPFKMVMHEDGFNYKLKEVKAKPASGNKKPRTQCKAR